MIDSGAEMVTHFLGSLQTLANSNITVYFDMIMEWKWVAEVSHMFSDLASHPIKYLVQSLAIPTWRRPRSDLDSDLQFVIISTVGLQTQNISTRLRHLASCAPVPTATAGAAGSQNTVRELITGSRDPEIPGSLPVC